MSISQQSRIGSPNPDWTRSSLSLICNIVRGASPRPAGDARYFNGNFIPWLTVAALTNISDSQLVVVETAGKLTEAGAQFSRMLTAGTVIIANSGATLGVAKILGITCCANDGIAALLDLRAEVEPRYVVHQINSQTDRLRKVVATGNGQPNLNTGLIGAIEIDLPCRAEQSAISDALDASNALIDSLEQMLTKKRQIKQGAMQELLTGKRRLPGFTGDWADCTLQQLADIRSGGTPSTRQAEFWDGAIPWCTPTDITALAGSKHISETERSISDKGQKASSAEMLPAGTIVMTSRATIGECAIASVPLTTNQGFKNFVPRDTTCGEFLYYLLGTQRSAFLTLCSGSTFLEIGKRQLEDFIVRCPIEYDEQHAIAEVLSSMDTEITALESRLTKARALKQAMAQALLTGRIRLVEPTA